MAKWVKFSDRMPTEGDLDTHGGLFLCGPDGKGEYMTFGPFSHAFKAIYERYEGYYWLENNAPPVPKPRTLEDVARDMIVRYSYHNPLSKLIKEMKEILERKDDERS